MKLIAASLLFFMSTFYGFSQEYIDLPDLKITNSLSIEKEVPVEDIKPEVIETIDIKSDYWDTQKFNPYSDALVKFPLQLKFDDINYASPILVEKVVTSRFGWRRGRPHKGIDIDLHTGDDVVSILDGVVRFVNYNSGHGKTVIVRHFNGLESTYAHLSAYDVHVNDTVRRGQILGKGGATGNARGSHLHLITSYKGIAINPEYIFDFKENKIRSSEMWVTRRWTDPYHHSSKRRSKLELLLSKEDAIASLTKEKKIYVVKRGDTLSHISRRNNVSIRAICVANNIKTTSLLKIGQKLVLEL